jgi:hypothetical protein
MTTDQRTLFPEPAIMVRGNQYLGGDGEQNSVRFPWIHNKDAVDLDFHSMDISPSKNHVAVP